MIQRAYKTELDPNNKQRTQFEHFAWVRMAVFNVGLRAWEYEYEHGQKPSAYKLKKEFNAVKDDLFPWARTAPYAVTEAAFRDLGDAFKHFFRRIKNGETPGYPKPQRYSAGFALRNINVKRDRVRLQGVGWVRLKERDYLPLTDSGLKFGTYATISQRAGHWFASVVVEESRPELNDRHDTVIGVDFGINALATCSNGKVFENPKPLESALRKLGRLNKELARRKKGGMNWRKTKAKLAKAHKRVADIRAHTLHQISDYLTREVRPACIVIENLNVRGMVKNRHLSRAIFDVGFGELRRQIEYKADWLGIEVLVVDRWYPSSKTCSKCGEVKSDLSLSDRVYRCDCGLEIDRDMNAALNLAALGRNRQTGGDCSGS
jgi:putative transposase